MLLLLVSLLPVCLPLACLAIAVVASNAIKHAYPELGVGMPDMWHSHISTSRLQQDCLKSFPSRFSTYSDGMFGCPVAWL